MLTAFTLTLTPSTSGQTTSTGSPHLFNVTLPEGIEGFCRRGGKGTTSRDWVAFGPKPVIDASASADFAAYMAWKAAQGQ